MHLPSVSLSHSGGWLVGAISTEGAIGVDIEQHRPDRDFIALASAAFGPQECRLVESGGGPEFYRIWTLREAMAKARGVGLALVVDGRDHVTANAVGLSRWQLAHSQPTPDLSLALVVEKRARLGPGAVLPGTRGPP